ncbi:SLC13 family permease [Fictibacillus sp. WQ 8-8]|uniref:SLC13 family permease n=1 Tax=Fictibacillus sp. WQ 8-8 TaxID=2938788 RepID=UPI00210AE84C|nr:SLC13 family permease [Fictibacillus sp. WQ 8-8]MCQ6268374.1 SLC13 family permease [Fictibacillus sp. WQ 8-8]
MANVGIRQEDLAVPLKRGRWLVVLKSPIFIVVSILLSILVYTQLPANVDYEPRATLAISTGAIALWVLEPIPFSMTAILILILLPVSGAVSMDLVLSGFASPAIFLILAGMMLACGLDQTLLGKRLAFQLLYWFGEKRGGILAGIILIPQIMAIFIPAAAVRTTMLLPIVFSVFSILGIEKGNVQGKKFMLGAAIGCNVSGTGILPAAIGNVVTVDLINYYLKQHITYMDWLILSLPLWLILIPVSWWVLNRTFPMEEKVPKGLKKEMKRLIVELGPITAQEKRTLLILTLVFLMWAMEDITGWPPVIPTFIGVLLMATPGIKIANWEKLLDIKFGPLILLAVTLSLGRALFETGAIKHISQWLENDYTLYLFSQPALSVLTVAILTQLIHKVTSNVSTAVIATVPVVISLAQHAGQSSSPLLLGFTAGITCLFGFLFVVETIPNVMVQQTGWVTQRDFIKPGLCLTIITTVLTYVLALTWWPWLGYL